MTSPNLETNSHSEFYVTGGTMSPNALSYVSRQADEELFDSLRSGQFCYVLTSRQMGKSSLMVRAVGRLRKEGFEVVVLDLTTIGQNVTPEQWYDGIQLQIGERLNLEYELNEFWLANGRLGPLQRWMKAMREVVLEKCKKPIVVFIDEVDVVHALKFSTSEFFAGIRAFYNSRNEDPELKRLHFCLIGVTTPSDLTKDVKTTPLNVGGLRIELADFTAANSTGLADNLGRDPQTNEQLLKRILYWTGGHPYLTQRFCKEVAEDSQIRSAEDIDNLCQREFLSPGARDTEDNLVFVRDRMLRSDEDVIGLLRLYSGIHKGKGIPNDNLNPFVKTLLLSGITRPTADGKLAIRNRIYHRVFDQQWIEDNMPDAELRKQRRVYRRRLATITAAAAVMAFFAIFSGVQLVRARSAKNEAEKERDNAKSLLSRLNLSEQSLADREEQNDQYKKSLDEQATKIAEKTIEANELKAEAKDLQEVAQEKSKQADLEKENNERLLYAAIMTRAGNLYDEGEIDTLIGELDRTDPKRRGVEWNHLKHLTEGVVPFEAAEEGNIDHLRFSSSGEYLVSKADDSSLLVWDPKTGKKLNMVADTTLEDTTFADMAFSSDNRWFASCGAEGEIILWDITTVPWKSRVLSLNKRPVKQSLSETCKYLSFSPDGQVLMAVTQEAGDGDFEQGKVFLRQWDVFNGDQISDRIDLAEYFAKFGHVTVEGFAFDGHLLVRYGNQLSVFGMRPKTGELKIIREENASPALYTFSKLYVGSARMATGMKSDKLFAFDKPYPISVRSTFKTDESARIMKQSNLAGGWRQLAFSRGAGLLAALNDREVMVWDTETGEIVSKIPLPQKINKSIAFSPIGNRLAVGGFDEDEFDPSTLTLWDIPFRADVFTFGDEKHEGTSPAGDGLVTMGNRRLTLWHTFDKKSFELVAGLEDHTEPLVRFSPDGAHVIVLFRKLFDQWSVSDIRLWNSMNGKETKLNPRSYCGFTEASNFSPDGRRLITICNDIEGEDFETSKVINTLRLWDVETGAELNKIPIRFTLTENFTLRENIGEAEGLHFLQKNNRVVLLDIEGKILGSWDLATGRGGTLDVCSEKAIRISPDGRWLITQDGKENYRLRSEANKRCVLGPMLLADEVQTLNDIRFSSDSRFLGLFYNADTQNHWGESRYIVRDLKTMKDILSEESQEGDSGQIQFSPSARWVVFGDNYWNLRTGKGDKIVGCTDNATFSADETRLITSCGDGNIKLWDLESGQEVMKIKTHDSGVEKVFIMPDNKHMLTATQKDVKLWRLRF